MIFQTLVLLSIFHDSLVHGHGRMLLPPNRSSIWRIPEFSSLNPPINWWDNAIMCGGVHQVDDPGTECGVCGDPLNQTTPRDNEIGGKYYRGIIVAVYKVGSIIDVEVEVTQTHLGNMEWRLCSKIEDANSQSCYNQNVLQLVDGGTRVAVDSTGMYRTKLLLPSGVSCDHGVLQWNYRAGNTWGICANGTGSRGCGPQTTIRDCADIRING